MNSYGYHEGYGTGIVIRVLTLNVPATPDDFMSVDLKPFKTAVWEALDGKNKKSIVFSYMVACAMFPSSLSAVINFRKKDPFLWWRNHESYTSLRYAKPASKYLCIFFLGIFLKKNRLRPWGRGILHERLHWQMYISKAKFKLKFIDIPKCILILCSFLNFISVYGCLRPYTFILRYD